MWAGSEPTGHQLKAYQLLCGISSMFIEDDSSSDREAILTRAWVQTLTTYSLPATP